MKQYFTRKNIITAFGLIVFGIIGRMLLQAYPNVETIMVVSVIAGALLGPYLGFVVALFSVIGSDMLIGNTSILAYTWTAWAMVGIASSVLKRKKRSTNNSSVRVGRDTALFTGAGLLGTVFFYAWTNFGVWHIGGLYPHTMQGLVNCYVMALPFLRNQLLGNLVIVPAVSVVFLTAWKYLPQLAAAKRKAALNAVSRSR